MSKFGCLPPKIDVRDYKVKAPMAVNYPESFELPHTRIKDQGTVGSCVAHATSSILEYYAGGAKLSTNFIYGIKKKECGYEDPGMYLKDACKIVQKYGDMLEEDCKGNDESPKCFPIAEAALNDSNKVEKAYEYRIDSYYSCQTGADIKFALMNYGPVLACIKWHDDYTINKITGVITFTNPEFNYHGVMIYGWNKYGWKIQNSWGREFGKDGCFILPWGTNPIEARVLIDHIDPKASTALVKVKTNKIKDIFYKGLNLILNFF